MPKQRPVSDKDRVARVVNARCFGGGAIQFDDLEIRSSAQIFLARKPYVVAPNEKAGQLLRNLVNSGFEFRGAEPHTVPEDAPLRVIARLDQFDFLAERQHLALPPAETLEILIRHKAAARIAPDQFRNGGASIADENREQFFRDGEDTAVGFVREAIVEYAGFQRAANIALDDKRRGSLSQIGFGLFRRANQFDACAALAYVGLNDERKIHSKPGANFVERAQSRGQSVTYDQFRFRSDFGTGEKQFFEGCHLGFTHYSAGENAGVRGGWHS